MSATRLFVGWAKIGLMLVATLDGLLERLFCISRFDFLRVLPGADRDFKKPFVFAKYK